MSRFFNRIDEDMLNQFELIHKAMRSKVYSIDASENILLDAVG